MGEVVTSSGARLWFGDGEVIKHHRPGTRADELRRRVELWPADVGLAPVLVDLSSDPPRTRWPRVSTVDPGDVPWAEAGRLLGRLHRAAPEDAPRHGWAGRLGRAVERAGQPWLAGLGRRLLDEVAAREEPGWLIHGDFHLGQMGWHRGRWCLLDPDDLGAGDPAWDLARMGGFWAAGLLPGAQWRAVVDGYRATACTPLARMENPWEALDLPARVAVYVAASRSETHDGPTASALLTACRRMAHLGHE